MNRKQLAALIDAEGLPTLLQALAEVLDHRHQDQEAEVLRWAADEVVEGVVYTLPFPTK